MFEGPEKKFQRHIAEYLIREHKYAVLEQDDITDTDYYLAEDHLIALPIERIEQAILLIREQKVMLDVDLAVLYEVPTKALNQAVKRNERRFPSDFMFALTRDEIMRISQIVTSSDIKYAKRVPLSPGCLKKILEDGQCAEISLSPLYFIESILLRTWGRGLIRYALC